MKKALLVLGLTVLALCQTALYRSGRLLDWAIDGGAGLEKRTAELERAARLHPWDDRVRFELGRAAFDRADEMLGNPEVRDAALALSVRHLLEALRLNPASAETHIRLARSLQYLSYLTLAAPVSYFEEYKKAATLTGHRSHIFYEVGRLLFGQWESLQPAEREFAIEVLKKALAVKTLDRLADLLEVWDLHCRDYAALEKILPEDAAAERLYARFLGEKSLSLLERWKALARAERLEFGIARNELDQPLRTDESYQDAGSAARVAAALKLLESLEFYQDLAREELIDPREHAALRKAARLFVARSVADRTRSLAESSAAIEDYLSLEDQPLAVGEFEKFLAGRGLVSTEGGAAASRPNDLLALSVELSLDFKQNRYRDIAMAAERLEKSAFAITEAGRAPYARILELAGDSYMKLDYLYDAERFYLKALEAAPDALAALLRLEVCYERLSDDVKRTVIRRRLEGLLGPPAADLGRKTLAAGAPLEFPLVCEGRPLTLSVSFETARPDARPLLTAVWNGRVVWEGFAGNGRVSFPVKTIAGTNSLILRTAREQVTLVGLERELGPQGPS